MNYLPPPFWSYPPPNNRRGNDREMQRTIERAVRRALQIKDHDKNQKQKKKDEQRKRSAQARATFFFAIEWYVLGLICSPFLTAVGHIVLKRLAE